jgi:hypothetical protein
MKLNAHKSECRSAALVLSGMALAAGVLYAQAPAAGPILSLTATSDNVAGAPDSVRIELIRWSTDAERDQLLSAWTMTGAAAPGRAGAAPPGAGGDGGRGAAGGRGGRGGRGGAGAAEAPPQTPETSLRDALGKVPTVGYLWSSEVAGYSLHYAVKIAGQDGGQHIILVTDRRLGAWNDSWKPAGANTSATNYEFSLIELHLNSKGEGEGKASLTGKVAVDNAAKTIALENYGSLPVVLKNVKGPKP